MDRWLDDRHDPPSGVGSRWLVFWDQGRRLVGVKWERFYRTFNREMTDAYRDGGGFVQKTLPLTSLCETCGHRSGLNIRAHRCSLFPRLLWNERPMKLQTFLCATLSLSLAFAVAAPVTYSQDSADGDSGQQQTRRRGGGFGGGGAGGGDPITGLLRSKEVREELKISADQEAAIRKLAEANRPERPAGMNFREMSQEDREAFFEKMRKEQIERMTQIKEQLEEVLLPEQLERAEQIALQVQGVRALSNEQVAEKIGLSADQQERLKEVQQTIQDDMRGKMREMFAGGMGGVDRDSMREKMLELRTEMEAKVLGVLTEEQKAKFEAMKGETFETAQRVGGFQGRGGQGGGQRFGRRGGRGNRAGSGQPGGESTDQTGQPEDTE